MTQAEMTNDEIVLTERAAKEIQELRAVNAIPESHRLRIGVSGGGCSGLAYHIGFDETVNESDMLLTLGGVEMTVDPRSYFYLKGVELDFAEGERGGGFVFNNPNAVRTCGCGSSLRA